MLTWLEINEIRGDIKIEKFHVLMEELKKLTPRQQEFLEKHLKKTGQTQLVNTLIESRVSATPIDVRVNFHVSRHQDILV